jgi:hypothetical protein
MSRTSDLLAKYRVPVPEVVVLQTGHKKVAGDDGMEWLSVDIEYAIRGLKLFRLSEGDRTTMSTCSNEEFQEILAALVDENLPSTPKNLEIVIINGEPQPGCTLLAQSDLGNPSLGCRRVYFVLYPAEAGHIFVHFVRVPVDLRRSCEPSLDNPGWGLY